MNFESNHWYKKINVESKSKYIKRSKPLQLPEKELRNFGFGFFN